MAIDLTLDATLHRLANDDAFASLRPSLATYYGEASRDAAMDNLYAAFVPDGGLAFDIGAHVGDRTACFRRLGARVVALEPQPLCLQALHQLYGEDPGVTIVPKACAAEPGTLTFHVNSANPTVSTASHTFVNKANGAEGWAEQNWDAELTVEATTLAELIAQHGLPDFIKIDVEGFEDVALSTLTQRPHALSFEFTTIERDVAYRALKRLEALGGYGFNLALGESQHLAYEPGEEVTPSHMADVIAALPHAANSGDVYAIRVPA